MGSAVKLLISTICCLIIGVASLAAAPYLEMSGSCDGGYSNSTNRFKIIGWNGRNKQALSERVYDFSVECNGASKHIMELFLASASSGRYRKEGFTLFKQEGTRRKSVKVRDSGCKLVPERKRTYPSDAEARAACRGVPTPMACELEYQGQDRWITVQVERCWRAQYESRDVPVWKPFPSGYAPLPPGVRMVQVSERQSTSTSAQAKRSRSQSPTSSEDGSGFGAFMVFGLLAGVGAAIFLKVSNAPLSNRISAVRQSIARQYQGFGSDIPAEDFRRPADGLVRKQLEDELAEHNSTLSALKESRELHQKASALVIDLEQLCGKLNYKKMDGQIESAKEVLKSKVLLSLLKGKDWHGFRDNVVSLTEALHGHIAHIQSLNTEDRHSGKQGSKRPSDDELPTSRQEAYRLLNISEDTPREVANKTYRALAKKWHFDKATDEVDWQRRDKKMKQLNAAKEYILGKRT